MRLARLHTLSEDPHASMASSAIQLPTELQFLGSGVDLGFEYISQGKERMALLDAFWTTGVRIPNSKYLLCSKGLRLANGTEPELPEHWKQGAWSLDATDQYVWVGKLVARADDIDKSEYTQYKDGWLRNGYI